MIRDSFGEYIPTEQDRIRKAVLAEREACAKAAIRCGEKACEDCLGNGQGPDMLGLGMHIAQCIRWRK